MDNALAPNDDLATRQFARQGNVPFESVGIHVIIRHQQQVIKKGIAVGEEGFVASNGINHAPKSCFKPFSWR